MIPIVQDKLKVWSVQEQMKEMMCIEKINSLLECKKMKLIEESELVKFKCLGCMISTFPSLMTQSQRKQMRIISMINFKSLSQIISKLIMTH